MPNQEHTRKSQIVQQNRNDSFTHIQQQIKKKIDNQQSEPIKPSNKLNNLQTLTASDIEKQRQTLVFGNDPNLNENVDLKVLQMKKKNSVYKPDIKKTPIKSNNNIIRRAKLLQKQSKENLF